MARLDDPQSRLECFEVKADAACGEFAFGWTAGAGVELKPQFLNGWRVKAEDLFVDLDV